MIISIFSCKKNNIDIHPIYLSAFKILENTDFIMTNEVVSDTLNYKVGFYKLSYEDVSLIGNENYQTLTLECAVDSLFYTLLSIEVTSEENIQVGFNLPLFSRSVTMENSAIGFSMSFNKEFQLNGISYQSLLIVNKTGSSGELIPVFYYSPQYGILRIVNNTSGEALNRCFECE
jgi:hypothetical protein